MLKKTMVGLFAALVLSPAAALAQRGGCTPGDTRPCRKYPVPYCYEECTSFGNWPTSCICEPPQVQQEQMSVFQMTRSQETKAQTK